MIENDGGLYFFDCDACGSGVGDIIGEEAVDYELRVTMACRQCGETETYTETGE